MVNSDMLILKKIVGYCDDINDANIYFNGSLEMLKINKHYRYETAMCVLQIGELSTRLSDMFLSEHKNILWKEIRGMRNIVAHHYGNIDIDILWSTISEDIPKLRVYCAKSMQEEGTL
ncbi:MAG: DUF86 domain-containing protein [Oscillospiraceae bacterium]|jgi:uncharacterized protein with HEPN domain|nr:DUF86 domain-containing protein [Oscillospiraceae bacterium]